MIMGSTRQTMGLVNDTKTGGKPLTVDGGGCFL